MLLEIEHASLPGRLRPFSAIVQPGELIHILGPNGAGKSSLLARLSGLLAGGGCVRFHGKPLENWSGQSLARLRAWLPQQQPAFSRMAVFQYLQQHMLSQAQPDERDLHTVLHRLQLHDKLSRPLTQLSGGEWQRVRLAAVLLQISPEIPSTGKLLLLDEPMSGLDVAQQAALDSLIEPRCRAGLTVIMSGHNLNHSLRHAQRVWLMQQGEVIAQGNVDAVMSAEQLQAVYGVPFLKLNVAGHQVLITGSSGSEVP